SQRVDDPSHTIVEDGLRCGLYERHPRHMTPLSQNRRLLLPRTEVGDKQQRARAYDKRDAKCEASESSQHGWRRSLALSEETGKPSGNLAPRHRIRKELQPQF